MVEIINNGDSRKFVELETYEKDLKILSNNSTLDVLIHALDELSKSKNNTSGNPFFRKVNSIRFDLKQIKEIINPQ